MTNSRIMLVEDHKNLGESLSKFLSEEGFEVRWAVNLNEAYQKLNDGADLIILDWNLPDGQGLDFLKRIRSDGLKIPVIFLTARVELVDKVVGLEFGADDYMTKPFESRELVARIRARLRNLSQSRSSDKISETNLVIGPLAIDKIKHAVKFKNTDVVLVRKEFDLLVLLAESPEKVFSRDEILNKVWGYDIYPTTRTVDMHVMQLRQKLSDELIETVRAVGYRLKKL